MKQFVMGAVSGMVFAGVLAMAQDFGDFYELESLGLQQQQLFEQQQQNSILRDFQRQQEIAPFLNPC